MTLEEPNGTAVAPDSKRGVGRRIAILLPDLRGGGAERVAITLAQGFAAAGFRPEFLLLAARGEYMPEVAGVFPVTVLPARRYLEVLPALIGHLRRDPPDALLAHMWPLTSIAPVAAWLARFRGRVVAVHHGQPRRSWRSRLVAALCLRFPVKVAAVSAGLACEIGRHAVLPTGRVVSLPNPFGPMRQPDSAAIARAEAAWRGTPKGGRILSVARLTPLKDQPMLLRALARMPASCRLMIVGNGSDEARLREMAAQLGLADRLILTGFLPDPTACYLTADVFALSSVSEGFGNVLVEALACGLPVVSTNCPFGPAEILGGGRYGRLVPVGDDAAMASALSEALADPGDAAMHKARAATYSVDAAVGRYADLLFAADAAGRAI